MAKPTKWRTNLVERNKIINILFLSIKVISNFIFFLSTEFIRHFVAVDILSHSAFCFPDFRSFVILVFFIFDRSFDILMFGILTPSKIFISKSRDSNHTCVASVTGFAMKALCHCSARKSRKVYNMTICRPFCYVFAVVALWTKG